MGGVWCGCVCVCACVCACVRGVFVLKHTPFHEHCDVQFIIVVVEKKNIYTSSQVTCFAVKGLQWWEVM